MKPDQNKDITERMAEMLRKHSLPYEEGTWERFKDYEASKRRKIVLWPYFSAAAAILLAVTLFMTREDDNVENDKQIAKTEIAPDKNPLEKNGSDDVYPIEPSVEQSDELIEGEPILTANVDKEAPLTLKNNRSLEPTDSGALNKSLSDQVELNQNPTNTKQEIQTSELLKSPSSKEKSTVAAQSAIAKSSKEKDTYSDKDLFAISDYDEKPSINDRSLSDTKWDFSLELSPNIKDRNINFGGGVAVAYNLSNKVAITSGVSYVQLDAHRNPNQVDGNIQSAPTEGATMASYNKSLNSINTSLAGLDIPVNLKVSLNNKVYASAGVSVFSVLNESRYNDVEERIPVLAYMSNSSQLKTPEPAIRTVYSQESNADAPYEGKNFTGFFNFSLGYKLPIFQKLNLAVEPYLKVPIGSLSDQDMDLSNGGLKIITSF